MGTRRSVLLGLALVVGIPAAAWPQAMTRSWLGYCTTGSFQACASVKVTLTPFYDPASSWGGYTAVTVRMQNMQGYLGETAWGWEGLRVTGLHGPASNPQGYNLFSVDPTFQDGATTVGTNYWGTWAGVWSAGTNHQPPGAAHSVGGFKRETQIGDGYWPVVGCAAPSPLRSNGMLPGDPYYTGGYFSTCGGGWVVYNFATPLLTFSDQTQVSISGYTSNSGQVSDFSCTFGGNCVQVVPEPVTMALLASGLLGVAGAARMRRRKSDEWSNHTS